VRKVAGFPEVWKFGTLERATRGTPILLVADATAAAGLRRYSTLRAQSTSAGYQVTAGRTLIITRVIYRATASGLVWQFSYGDDDVGRASAVAPTNEVGIDSMILTVGSVLIANSAGTPYTTDYYITVPAGKYLAIAHQQASDALHVLALGVEV